MLWFLAPCSNLPKLIAFKQSISRYDISFDDLIAKAFGEGNLSEDILEKWINECKIDNEMTEGQVDYNKLLHKMSKQKKKKPEGYLYKEMWVVLREYVICGGRNFNNFSNIINVLAQTTINFCNFYDKFVVL